MIDFTSDATEVLPPPTTQMQSTAEAVERPRLVLNFNAPIHDKEWFRVPNAACPLGRGVRDDVRLTLRLLERIHGSRNRLETMRLIAAEMHHARGYSVESLRRKYYAFTAGGDWRVLIDRSRAPAESVLLPVDFLSFVASLVERNQRATGMAAAVRALHAVWRDARHTAPCDVVVGGKLVKRGMPMATCPGYEQWPAADWHGEYPEGWSYDNLNRRLKRHLSSFTKTAARIGRGAAAVYRPKVLTSRVGLLAGEYYQFDDDVNDLRVNFTGNIRRVMRPLGLTCLDLLSACAIRYGWKPTIWDEATDAKKVLTQDDMFWFSVNVLTTVGYRDDERGTKFILEHGTAAISSDFEQRIADATGMRVRCERSGIDRRPPAPGMFEGVARGNFRFKASLESFFNLKRNEMALLPGATGRNRDNAPEGNEAAERYNARLMLASLTLPAEQAERLVFPFLGWGEFTRLALDLMDAINGRTKHTLEGWEKLGFVDKQFRLPGTEAFLPWGNFEALPPVTQQALVPMFKSDATLMRIAKMSPAQVWRQQSAGLVKVPDAALCDLLGEALGTEVRVGRSAEVEIHRQEIDSEPLVYHARVRGERLPEGEKYLAYLNPYAPDRLALFDAQQRHVGTLERRTAVSRNDIEGLRRQMGEVRKMEAEDLLPMAQRGAAVARAAIEMRENNAAVLAEAGSSPAAGRQQARGNPLAPRSEAELKQQSERLAEEAEMAAALHTDIS